MLAAIDAPDCLHGALGGRSGRRAHHALATLNDIMAGKKVSSVLAADLRNCFGRLEHPWAMRCRPRRVGEPRRLTRIRRWLKAGVLRPDGAMEAVACGSPQGGRSSVLLSHVSLHDVVDGWMAKKIRKPLEGEAYWVRYRDDFVLCLQYRSDARRVHTRLAERRQSLGWELAPATTRLSAFGRFAQRAAAQQGQRRPETVSFLGFTHACARNRQGHGTVERRTERKRRQRAVPTIQQRIRDRLHAPMHEQQHALNQSLRGHYNDYGIAGKIQSLLRISRRTETLWRKT